MKFKEKQRVAYVPLHAKYDINHPDCDFGVVSTVGKRFVFVKFDEQVKKLGWLGTTSQSCDPDDLILV